MKLILFDIDGTLIHSGGAGVRAMTDAFEQLHGVADAFQGISLAGRTDTTILADAYEKSGLPMSPEHETLFKKRYAELLPAELEQPSHLRRIMPGVETLLPVLQDRDDLRLGLLTGNWEVSGRIKLVYFGINDYFPFGAFSDDSPQRDQLLPFAVERCKDMYQWEANGSDIFVIGDTPSDILCAHPHGAKAIAVAAAGYSIEDLRAYDPDYLLPDLSDTEAMLRILA
ncbi:HAD hydrolase-like protein [candidate division KSB1 bacterium]|nr:HAD hydrolase-like protein [candidate division KSB1 bacterium]